MQFADLEKPETSEARKEELVDLFLKYFLKYNLELKTELHNSNNEILIKIILFIKERIKLYEELSKFKFFFKNPDYKSESLIKNKVKIMKDEEKSKKLIKDIINLFEEKLNKIDFDIVNIAKVCGEFLFQNKIYTNEEFYGMLRLILSGNSVGGPVTQICEILGKKETLRRLNLCSKY